MSNSRQEDEGAAEIQARKERIDKIKKDRAQEKAEKDRLIEKNSKLEERNNDLQSKLNSAIAKNIRLENENKSLSTQNIDLRKQLFDLKNQLKEKAKALIPTSRIINPKNPEEEQNAATKDFHADESHRDSLLSLNWFSANRQVTPDTSSPPAAEIAVIKNGK